MSGLLQNGNVVIGHQALWATDGVIQDSGPVPGSTQVLASIRGADFNSTYDQPILMPPAVVSFQLSGIIVTNATAPLTNAMGGFYPQFGKGGGALVAVTQTYSALTDDDLLLNATLTPYAQGERFSANNLPYLLTRNNQNALAIFFSLTTAQGVPAFADIYVVGSILAKTNKSNISGTYLISENGDILISESGAILVNG